MQEETISQIKQLTKASDLEGVKTLDEVETTYFIPNSDLSQLPCRSKGIFGGNFKLNKEDYIMVAKVRPSTLYLNKFLLTSYFYKVNNNNLVMDMHFFSNHFTEEEPTRDFPNLERLMKNHIKEFTYEAKMRRRRKMQIENAQYQ